MTWIKEWRTKSSHPSSSQGNAPLSLCLCIKKVLQSFDLCQVEPTTLKSASSELSRLSGSAEFEVRERRKYGRDNGATGVKMQFDYILCSK
jgi:hypothetical protein